MVQDIKKQNTPMHTLFSSERKSGSSVLLSRNFEHTAKKIVAQGKLRFLFSYDREEPNLKGDGTHRVKGKIDRVRLLKALLKANTSGYKMSPHENKLIREFWRKLREFNLVNTGFLGKNQDQIKKTLQDWKKKYGVSSQNPSIAAMLEAHLRLTYCCLTAEPFYLPAWQQNLMDKKIQLSWKGEGAPVWLQEGLYHTLYKAVFIAYEPEILWTHARTMPSDGRKNTWQEKFYQDAFEQRPDAKQYGNALLVRPKPAPDKTIEHGEPIMPQGPGQRQGLLFGTELKKKKEQMPGPAQRTPRQTRAHRKRREVLGNTPKIARMAAAIRVQGRL